MGYETDHQWEGSAAKTNPACLDLEQRLVSGYKYVGRYCLPEIESTETYKTRAEARMALMQWKREADEKGQHVIGRTVATNAGDQRPVERKGGNTE